MDEQYIICRICLSIMESDYYKYLDELYDENEKITIRDMLLICVPELDSYVSTHPVVCLECLKTMTSYYSFKSKCMETENKIREYIKKNNLVDYNQVNLNCIVRENVMKGQNLDLSNKFMNRIIIAKTDNDKFVIINGFQNNIINVKNDNSAQTVPLEEASKNNGALQSHPMQLPHPECPELLFSCKKCPFFSTDSAKMNEHKCCVETFSCGMCTFTTRDRNEMQRHNNTAHRKPPRYYCPNCDFATADASSLRRHRKNQHTHVEDPPKILPCVECSFVANSEFNYNRHMQKHLKSSLLKCEYCSYETKDRSNFKKHQFIHNTNKPVRCNFCVYQCVSPYQMRRHIKNHHDTDAPIDSMFHEAPEQVQWMGHCTT